MVDLGSAKLPLNVFAHLLHLGKAAVSLCGDCSVASRATNQSWGTAAEAPRLTAAPDRRLRH